MDIATVLTSIKTAAEIAKLIKDSGVSLEKSETKLKLADLLSALADAKTEIAGVQQILIEKDATIRTLTEQLNQKISMRFKKPFYYADEDPVPFCPTCWEVHKRQTHLNGPDQFGDFQCVPCKHTFDRHA